MIVYQLRSVEDEYEFRFRALRSAIICLAISKMCSVSCYVLLYFIVMHNTPGFYPYWAELILILILGVIFLTIVLASLLVAVARTESACVMIMAVCIAIMLAIVDMFLGVFAAIYYIRFGHKAEHYFLAAAFICLALSYIPVLGNDWYLIYSYKKLLEE